MKTSAILLSLALVATSVSAAPQRGRFGQGQGQGQGQRGQQGQQGKGAAANNAGAATANNATAAAGQATANNATATAAAAGNKGTGTQAAAGALSSTDITTDATEDNSDAQSSLTLDPRVIATGFKNNGQDVQEAGQVASLTSNNNFINFCLTQGNLPITNGKQIQSGSCNPAPIGTIPAVGNMPSAKFANPANGDTIPANQAFTITMNINNLATGNFVNANENYFAAPQQLNGQGLIVGHTHVVIEALSDLAQTTPTNPQQFAFFKGVNTPAQNGAVTADVTNGVPAGAYRLCSINSSSNHQPVIVPIAQHGSLDDCVYFTASGGGSATAANATAAGAAAGAAANAANSTAATGAGAAAAGAGAAAAGAGAAAAAGKGNKGQAANAGQAKGQAAAGQAAAGQAKGQAAAGQAKGQAAQAAAGQKAGQAAKGQQGGRNRRMTLSRL